MNGWGPMMRFAVIFGLAAGVLLPAPVRAQTAPAADDAAILKDILNNAWAYCQKLQNYAYYFVCQEVVVETLRGRSQVRWSSPPMAGATPQSPDDMGSTTMSVTETNTRNSYLYDYQLIRKRGNDQETRTLLEKNGQRVAVPDAKLEAMRFYFKNFAFGPVDLFGVVGRLRHEYRIVGRDAFNGEKAIIVEVAATGETADYNPSGKVWVREGDSAILKIEWDQTALAGFKDVQAAADAVNAVPMFTLVTEYGVEKNGIRFPSKALFREAYLRTKNKKVQEVSVVTIGYKDYKFFQVDVETK